MSRGLRITGIVLGSVAAVVLVALGAVWGLSNRKIQRHYDIPRTMLSVAPPEAQTPERGFAMAVVHACTHCHTADLGGGVMPEVASLGTIVAPNLRRGGGLADTYTDEDWARAIRGGVHADGTPLLFMPGNHPFADMPDEDLAAIIAYLRSQPPLARELPEMELSFAGRLAILSGMAPIDAEHIDFASVPFRRTPGVSVENGRYLAQLCTTCHGSDLGGLPPGFSHARAGGNLTPAGPLKEWTEEGFVAFMQTGTTPAGRSLDPAGMPWKAFGLLTEDEIRSLWRYLEQAPPVDRTVRKPAPTQTAGTN